MSEKINNQKVFSYKEFLRDIGRRTLIISRWIISRLPYPVFKALTPILIVIGRPFIRRKKRLALENLHSALGREKTKEEIARIARRCFDNIGAGMIDFIYFLDHPKVILEKVSIEGIENLDDALKKGRGAILLSAHFGHFILMYFKMAAAGYTVNCIMKRMRDERFEEYISEIRDNNGIQTIYSLPHRTCVSQSLKCLRDNEVLFILLDQNYGDDGGVFVDFFGKPAATATGPVIFSSRSGAPILPIFIMQDSSGQHRITIAPPVELESAEAGQVDLVRNTAQLTKIIEGYIRQYPHEWGGWMHRRWKNKPSAHEDQS